MAMATSRKAGPSNPPVIELAVSELDLVASSPSNSEDARFDAVVGELEDVLMDDAFIHLQTAFFAKHHTKFDASTDENKLEYMEIFRLYTTQIEKYLSKRLVTRLPWFSMTDFMNMLRSRPDQVQGDVFDLLQTLGDYTEFKDMMMSYKRDCDGDGVDLSGLLAVTSVKGTSSGGGDKKRGDENRGGGDTDRSPVSATRLTSK